jgi:hypothetical protein
LVQLQPLCRFNHCSKRLHTHHSAGENLTLTSFSGSSPDVLAGASWHRLPAFKWLCHQRERERESNGGFMQMALYSGRNHDELDASNYAGIELLLYGNNENCSVHIRTSDCAWQMPASATVNNKIFLLGQQATYLFIDFTGNQRQCQ